MFSEIKDYYDTIKGSYVVVCKEEKDADLKSKLGHRLNSFLVVLFVLTFSQVIPLSVLGLLPEAFKLIPFWKIGIPTIIPINILILIILKKLHSLNEDKLVYARVRDRRQAGRMSPLQKAFSAIFTALIELKAYSETSDEFHIRAAGKHYDIFRDTLPFELRFMDGVSAYADTVFVKRYRENHLPWFSLIAEQIDDIETIRYFVWQTTIRIWDKEKVTDIIPALEALSKVYFDALKNKHSMSQDFLEFKEKAKAIPSFRRSQKSSTARLEDKVAAFIEKITKNSFLYFMLSFTGWLVATFILVYWPCREFFDASPKTLAPVVFATAITLALMDTQKNMKTDLSDKGRNKKPDTHDDEQNRDNS